MQVQAEGGAVVHAGQHGQRAGHHADAVPADPGARRGGAGDDGAGAREVDAVPVPRGAPRPAGTDHAQRAVLLLRLGARATEVPAHVDERRGVCGLDVVMQRPVHDRPRVVDPCSHASPAVSKGTAPEL
ncbi:hypothetical protein GY12_10790 [Micrococcus luteus]|nr:hypothetical protein GY12_10790 [Micrococcus luteus]